MEYLPQDHTASTRIRTAGRSSIEFSDRADATFDFDSCAFRASMRDVKPSVLPWNPARGRSLPLLAAMAILAIACMAGGCGRPSSSDTENHLRGEFVLESVDGKNLPAQVAHDRATIEVRAGRITFEPEGVCVSLTTFVAPSGEEIHREVTADYDLDGAKVHMNWRDAGNTIGTMEGETFTMNNEGMVFRYRRSTPPPDPGADSGPGGDAASAAGSTPAQ